MFEYLNKFERWVYLILTVLLAVVIAFSVFELALLVGYGIVDDRTFRLENHELLSVFGAFLLVLIGIELLDTMRAYVEKHEVHVEVIMLVAIIAIARKIILFESSEMADLPLIGMALLLMALAAGYYIVVKTRRLQNGE
jgi:uncharacterized membrane protein (DUF373 family)